MLYLEEYMEHKKCYGCDTKRGESYPCCLMQVAAVPSKFTHARAPPKY